jgi:dienelactone hydrolase
MSMQSVPDAVSMSRWSERFLATVIGVAACSAAACRGAPPAIELSAADESVVFSGTYSNNGAVPMWCYGSTVMVRLGNDVFVSALERLPDSRPANDCRWALFGRTAAGWTRVQADDKDRQREPCPIACLPAATILLSSNPTLLPREAAGRGPARPELLLFDAASAASPPRAILPEWAGNAGFSEHSYRSFAADRARGEVILFQDVGFSHAEWALRDREGKWLAGRLPWPACGPGDLEPYGAKQVRVHYGPVVLRDRAVHFCGVAAYDNWSRVKTYADLGHDAASGPPGMATRKRGNRMRRLYYTSTERIGAQPFRDWVVIDDTFTDGGWLFPGDMHVDAAGTVHLLWYRAPMMRSLRDAQYPDIPLVHSIEYAVIRGGKIVHRQSLLRAGEGHQAAVPADLDREAMPYVGPEGGEKIFGDAIATPRFHVAPDGRLFVVAYACDGRDRSENRILEILPDGKASAWKTIPLAHPLTQFFTATPRAGCEPSWTLDLCGHRRGDWRHREGSNLSEYEGALSYARVGITPTVKSAEVAPAPPAAVVPGPRMLADFMNAEANRLLDRRDAEIAAITTPEQVRARQARMRKWFAEKLGAMPPKARRPPRIVGEIDCDGYRVQKVIYDTWPDHPVTAAFYLPDERADRPGPFPGVLLPCGHSDAAKAHDSYQAASILLARHGFAVLCFDPIGQGERRQFPDRDWGSYPSLEEHMEVTGAALLIGRQAASYFVGDLVRSLDYLASRPEVDATRLGCTGISGGGMQTAYLMALDDRLKAAAPGCFITGYRRQLATRGVEEAEQNIGGQLPIGLDHGDYLVMAAPITSLVLAATRDFFDITGTRATAAEAKRLFGLLGHAERMEIAERDVEHGFGQPLREAALAWMNRWLKDNRSAPAETPPQLLSREQLQCTPEGNVYRAGLGKTTMDLIADEENALARKRATLAVGRTPAELAATVRGLLKLPAAVPPATVAAPPAAEEGAKARRLVFATEPGIVVPALVAEPPAAAAAQTPAPLAIILADGDLDEAMRGEAAADAVARGMRVLAISVRGTGESAPKVRLNEQLAPLFGHDWQEALFGVLLDRPLLGQKVSDVLAVIAWANETYGANVPIHLHGRAATGPVALHAAVLADAERKIAAVTLADSLTSWQSLVQARFHARELANVVPGALVHYDLPDLAAALGDRLTIDRAGRRTP